MEGIVGEPRHFPQHDTGLIFWIPGFMMLAGLRYPKLALPHMNMEPQEGPLSVVEKAARRGSGLPKP